MKYLFILLLINLSFVSPKSFDYSPDQLLGNWMSPQKDLIINCYKVNGQYFGKVVWFKKYYDEKHGKNLAVPEEHWLNYEVMKHFVFSNNEWKDGEIYDLNTGKSYSAYITLDGPNTLKLKGYIWLTIFGETTEFTRYTESKLPDFK